jgi:hypothetical protein
MNAAPRVTITPMDAAAELASSILVAVNVARRDLKSSKENVVRHI